MSSDYVGTIDDWIYIYRQFIPNNLYNDLTCKIVVNDNGEDHEEVIHLYDEINENIIAIPRYCSYGIELLSNNKLLDSRSNGADIDIELKVNPRDHYQEEAIDAIISNEHGILCAKTAFGKTYVAINAISKLKKRALILMHKKDLTKQWKDDILKYTNLTDDDVQIFTGNEKKFKTGKAITITTVQNICAKIRDNNFHLREIFKKENFGITIYDECHTTVGPLVNTLSSRWIFSKRVYGLSATPVRGDALDKVINCILGNIIYTDSRKMLPVYVAFAPAYCEVPKKTLYYFNYSQKQYTIRYNKWLCKQDNYIEYAASIITNLIKHNKKILVVAALKDLLEIVYNKTVSIMEEENIELSKVRVVHGTSTDTFDNIKAMTEEEIDNFNCIFSTNKFFSEGLSLNWLDSIVYLTSPSAKSLSSIPQLVGRIVREYKNKDHVLVVDIFNKAFNIEQIRYRKRIQAYEGFKYNILNLNDKFETTKDGANKFVDNLFSTIDNVRNGNVLFTI